MDYLGPLHLELLQQEHLEEAVFCINTEFVKNDPVAVALSLSTEDCLLHDRLTITNALPEKLSMVAIDRTSGRLLGCIIAKDFSSPEPKDLTKLCPKMKPLLALIKQLESGYIPQTNVCKGEIRYGLMSAVRNDVSNQGIFTKLYQAVLENAKQRGFRKTIGVVAHPASQHTLIHKFGHRVVSQVNYQSFFYEGVRPLANLTNPSSCLLLERDL